MKKILAFALALMLAIPAMAFADGRDADITALGTATVTADPNQVTVIANASVTAKTVGETQEATPRPSRGIRRIIRCASPATTSKCSTAWSARSRTAV